MNFVLKTTNKEVDNQYARHPAYKLPSRCTVCETIRAKYCSCIQEYKFR